MPLRKRPRIEHNVRLRFKRRESFEAGAAPSQYWMEREEAKPRLLCREDGGSLKMFTLPVGAFVEVSNSTLRSGLVAAKWKGRDVSLYSQDLRARAEP